MKLIIFSLFAILLLPVFVHADITDAQFADLTKKIDTLTTQLDKVATDTKVEDLSKKVDTLAVQVDKVITDTRTEDMGKKLDDLIKSSKDYQSKGSMAVHGTEYTVGQAGKVWLQLINASGETVQNGVCYVDIYSPNGGGAVVERATMTNMNHDGVYYYNFLVPIEQGVYPVIAICYYVAGQVDNFANSSFMLNGTIDTGTVINTRVEDGSYLATTESSAGLGNPRRITQQYNFSTGNICNVSQLLLTGVTFRWVGRWNSNIGNDVITMQIFNYTSSNWINMSNTITGAGTGAKSITNSFSLNNMSTAGLVNASGSNLLMRFVDTSLADATSTGFDTDYLSVKCDQLSFPVWQTIRGSSEIHVSSDLLYYVGSDLFFTLNNTQSVTLHNGTVIDEIYYTGIFKNNFYIESGADEENVLIEYQGLHSIPCNSVISFYKKNASGYYQYPYKTQRQTEEDHCSINFYINLTVGETTEFESHARNVWESEIRSTNTGVGAIYPLVNSGCLLWQILHGYPAYITPKNQTNEIYDYYYRACANFYDDYYWFNQTYQTSLRDKQNISDEVSYLQYESDYFSMIFAKEKLNIITSLLLNNLQAVSDYSKLIIANPLAPLTNMSDQKVWAQYSTVYQNYLVLNASCGTGTCIINGSSVWDYPIRNLTFYDTNITATVTVNSTEIAENVWNYSGTVNPSLLSQFVNGIWNYTSTISSNILDSVSNAVWTRSDRNLTYYAQVDINYSMIDTAVWNSSNKYTHGVVLN